MTSTTTAAAKFLHTQIKIGYDFLNLPKGHEFYDFADVEEETLAFMSRDLYSTLLPITKDIFIKIVMNMHSSDQKEYLDKIEAARFISEMPTIKSVFKIWEDSCSKRDWGCVSLDYKMLKSIMEINIDKFDFADVFPSSIIKSGDKYFVIPNSDDDKKLILKTNRGVYFSRWYNLDHSDLPSTRDLDTFLVIAKEKKHIKTFEEVEIDHEYGDMITYYNSFIPTYISYGLVEVDVDMTIRHYLSEINHPVISKDLTKLSDRDSWMKNPTTIDASIFFKTNRWGCYPSEEFLGQKFDDAEVVGEVEFGVKNPKYVVLSHLFNSKNI